MTDKDRKYRRLEASYSDQPWNTGGMEFLAIKLDSIEVGGWHPLPDGQGEPTEVHLSMMIDGLDLPMIIRFKGPGTLDALISALAVHRFTVWPDQDYTDEEFARDGR